MVGIFDVAANMAKAPVTAKLGRSTFWAERGLVHYFIDGDLDEGDDKRYDSMRIRDALLKLRHINLITAQLQKMPVKNQKSIREHRKFVDDMIEVCRMAQKQGSPFNQDVVRDAVQSRRRSRISVIDPKTKIVTPGEGFNPLRVLPTLPSEEV